MLLDGAILRAADATYLAGVLLTIQHDVNVAVIKVLDEFPDKIV
jgi:hypothetical protein